MNKTISINELSCGCKGQFSLAASLDVPIICLDLLPSDSARVAAENKSFTRKLETKPMLEIEAELHIGPTWVCDGCWDRSGYGFLLDVLCKLRQAIPNKIERCHGIILHPDLLAKRDFLRNEVTVLVALGMTTDSAVAPSEAPYIAQLVQAAIGQVAFTEADWKHYEVGQLLAKQITSVDILSEKAFQKAGGVVSFGSSVLNIPSRAVFVRKVRFTADYETPYPKRSHLSQISKT